MQDILVKKLRMGTSDALLFARYLIESDDEPMIEFNDGSSTTQ